MKRKIIKNERNKENSSHELTVAYETESYGEKLEYEIGYIDERRINDFTKEKK